MNNSCLSLLKELEKRDIIKPDELKRAELYLQFSHDPNFNQLDQAAKWVIDNNLVCQSRIVDITQKLKKLFPKSPLFADKPASSASLEERLLQPEDSDKKAIIQDGAIKSDADNAAFEHNNRLLFRCYSGGLISLEQYNKSHAELDKLNPILLPNQEAIINWLIEEKIYSPSRTHIARKRSTQQEIIHAPEKSGWIKKLGTILLICGIVGFSINELVVAKLINIYDILH